MGRTVRLSFTLDEGLARKLEELRRRRGYSNRSEFVRDALRNYLVREAWQESSRSVVGTLTLVYDHHTPGLTERLTGIQHDHHGEILASTHVHLDHDTCVEVIIVKGPAARVAALADALGRERGVLHATMCSSSTGEAFR